MKKIWIRQYKIEILLILASFILVAIYLLFGHEIIKLLFEGKAIALLNAIFGKGNVRHLSDSGKANWVVFNLIVCFYIFLAVFSLLMKRKKIKAYYKKIIVSCFVLYLFFGARFFFLGSQSPYFNKDFLNQPLIHDDYAFHFIDTVESSSFLRENHRIWGYNPYYFAGYPSQVFLSIDTHLTIFINLILSGLLNPALLFNLSIFLSFIVLPILAFFTAKNFNIGKINSLFFFIFCIYFIVGFHRIRTFYIFGGYSFIIGVFLSLYVASLFYKYLEDKKPSILIHLTFFGSVAFFIHPLSSLMSFIFCGTLLIFYSNRLNLKDYFKFIICLIVIFVTNLIWIIPKIQFFNLLGDLAFYMQTQFPDVFTKVIETRSFIFLFILFLFSVYKSNKSRERKFTSSMLISFLILMIVSLFGSQIGLSDLQPTRFIIPTALLALLFISIQIKRRYEEKNVIFFLFLTILIATFILASYPIKFSYGYREYPAATKIFEFLKTNTSPKSRTHVQDSHHHPYFKSHFTAFIPYKTSRAIVGGPFTYPLTKFKFSQFVDDNLFGKNLNEISDEEMESYLELYNIKYFLVFSDRARHYFGCKKKFKKVFHHDRFSIHEYLEADESFCYECQAVVEADYDRISVKGATSGKTILKFHYIKSLKIMPEGLRIEPIRLLKDPNPFIMVENGNCSDFIIYN